MDGRHDDRALGQAPVQEDEGVLDGVRRRCVVVVEARRRVGGKNVIVFS
jgi:hypothetical protein